MWIFLSDSFLSIVQDKDDLDRLLVRARRQNDIKRVFPGVRARRTPDGDYLYRASIPRTKVAALLAVKVRQIRYGNFKDSVSEDDRHSAYLGVWSRMLQFQPRRGRRYGAMSHRDLVREHDSLFGLPEEMP